MKAFAPDILQLRDAPVAQNVGCTLTVRRNMAHCRPICPIPEADEALTMIRNTITR